MVLSAFPACAGQSESALGLKSAALKAVVPVAMLANCHYAQGSVFWSQVRKGNHWKFRYVHLSPVSAAVLESWANEGGVMFNLHP
jgi:hypothetical protein